MSEQDNDNAILDEDVTQPGENSIPATPLEPAQPGSDLPPDEPDEPEPPRDTTLTRFAIVEDDVVRNVTAAERWYGQEQGWVETDTAGIGWTYDADTGALTPPAMSTPTREQLIEAVTAHRWAVETGGIALPTGAVVHTTIDDQNRITSVIANAQAAGVEQVDFKAASGWVTLTIAELQGVAAAIALHVQASFSAERAHHEALADWPGDGLAEYDITTGWPPNAPQPTDETPTDPGHEPGSSHLEP